MWLLRPKLLIFIGRGVRFELATPCAQAREEPSIRSTCSCGFQQLGASAFAQPTSVPLVNSDQPDKLGFVAHLSISETESAVKCTTRV